MAGLYMISVRQNGASVHEICCTGPTSEYVTVLAVFTSMYDFL